MVRIMCQPVQQYKHHVVRSIARSRIRTAVQASCEKHSTEWRLPRWCPVVPAATVTTGAKPHGQQQLARDLEVVPAATVTTGVKPHGQQQLARDLEVGARCHGAALSASNFGEVQRCYPLYFVPHTSTPVVGHPLPISCPEI